MATYTDATYRSLSAYKFINGKTETWVRWRFEPSGGDKFLTDAEASSAPYDFLDQRLSETTHKGPAKWTMIAIIGQPRPTTRSCNIVRRPMRNPFPAA